jgi:biotin carboxyl carrier protein
MSESRAMPRPEEGATPAASALPAWETFITARTADAHCRAWLALVCERVPGAQAGAVLVQGVDASTFVPMAVWPGATPDLGRLGKVVEVALRERRGVVQPLAEGGSGSHLAYPVLQGQRVVAVVALETTDSKAGVDAGLREIHWGSAWLSQLFATRELEEALQGRARVGSVLEVMAVALRHGKLQQALFEVSNELRRQLDCTRVAIGLVNNAAVRLAALSEAATFEKGTALAKAYVAAMEEAYDRNLPVAAPAVEGEAATAADALRAIAGAAHVLSFPLLLEADCVAVLTLERSETAFGDADLLWLDAFGVLVAPVLAQRQAAERNTLTRLASEGRMLLNRLFGPRHLVWKAGASVLLALVVLMLLIPFQYRVAAKTVIEGEVQRVAAAPFEGFIGAGFVRAGDTVRRGQPLAQLDDRELRLEQARWTSERDQYDNRLREAMAMHDLTAVQVVGAQLRQAQAQLDLVTEKIRRATLTAPYDGIVVSGDLSQQIGAPVEAGKTLFEVAPLSSYRIILQVDEREIRHVQVGQRGRLVITGIAEDPLAFEVAKVTPVATAKDGKNFFRIEARLPAGSPRLRPGMEGVGKIEVGRRSLWWVMTHTFADWLRLTLWTWLP